jgi:hypothetical protein
VSFCSSAGKGIGRFIAPSGFLITDPVLLAAFIYQWGSKQGGRIVHVEGGEAGMLPPSER